MQPTLCMGGEFGMLKQAPSIQRFNTYRANGARPWVGRPVLGPDLLYSQCQVHLHSTRPTTSGETCTCRRSHIFIESIL
jgi:hypothetical protein